MAGAGGRDRAGGSGSVSGGEGLRKFGKRRREDDFDINSIKRRAVSPSLSVHGSPVVGQSPSQRDGGLGGLNGAGGGGAQGGWSWGGPPRTAARENSVGVGPVVEPTRSNSGGSTMSVASTATTLGPREKRVGLQGMVDTHDGLMKMSIE